MTKISSFLYKIRNPCNVVWFTSDPVYAQEASNAGCIVNCKAISNIRVFKASTNINKNTKPETVVRDKKL